MDETVKHPTMMSKKPFPVWLAIAFLIFIPTPVQAQKLRVAALGAAPFVIPEADTPTGISVDVWETVAQESNLQYQLIYRNDMAQTLNLLNKGQLDLAIGPISITSERLKKVAFTHPFFQAEIGLLIPNQEPSLWSRVRPFFRLAFLSSISLLLTGLFIVGNLLWLAERDRNSAHFPKRYFRGVGNGMWFALVTLTTVGYGDYTPVTVWGRMIAGVWMLITTVSISSLTAGIATALTLSLSNMETNRFQNPEDIKGARIAVVRDSTGAKWAKDYQGRLIYTNSLKEAIALVINGKTDGVIFDSPALQFYLQQHPDLPLKLADFPIAIENYGFMLPPNSPLLQTVNIKLLELQEAGELKAIKEKWLK